MGEQRNGSGRFTPEHTDDELLAAVRAHEPAATSEVADEVGMTRQGADRRLRQLRDEGRVSSKKIGASLVWFAPNAESGRESDETPVEHDTVATTTDTVDRRDPPSTSHTPNGEGKGASDAPDAGTDVVERVAEEWEDTDDRLEARKAAARGVLEYAREHGSVSKTEAKSEVYHEYPVGEQNPRTWYRKNIRPVLNEAAEYDPSARTYRLDDDGEA